jgi:SNF2 family DNA or RNA helicase
MSNGTLKWDGKSWIVDVKPHVALRFKANFRSIRFEEICPFKLTDRPDTAIELDWFFSRFPVEMDKPTAKQLKSGVKEYLKREEEQSSILSTDWKQPPVVGFREGESPFPYQSRAAALAKATGRLLLLDDVGIGKTLSALALLADGEHLPAVVVVQPHLSEQWVVEYIEAFTHLRAHEVKTRTPGKLPEADVYVFRYSNIAGWTNYFKTMGLKAVIFDEIQELRHGTDTEKGRAAKILAASAPLVMGLTATPIYNYGSEIFNVIEYVAPGCLGTWEEFQVQWCKMSGTHWIVKDPDALGSYLQAARITLRRTENDPEVAEQRPPLNKIMIEVDWNEGDAQTDVDLQRSLAQRVLNGRFTERGQAARDLDMLVRQSTGIAKARSVAMYVRMLVEAGESVLLAGWHRETYRIWNEVLGDLNPVMFTGSESQAKKKLAKAAFIEGRSKLMIISLRSGAGLDGLQRVCRHVVVGELDWSPQVHKQVEGRLRRRGQPDQVHAHYLYVDGGSDPVLITTLGLKASQSHGIIDPYSSPAEQDNDESRMRRLAQQILDSIPPQAIAA